MRRISFVIASVFFASALLGCPLLKKKQGDDSVLDAATVSVSGTGAKNEKDILRYANEEALDEVAVIGHEGAKARNFPGNGPEVATLPKGAVVKKMAKYFSTGVLVMFDDPAASDGSKLMGWVPPNAFDVAAPKPVWTPPKIIDAGTTIKPTVTDAGGGGTTVVDSGAAKTDAGGGTAAVDAGGGGGGKIPTPGIGTVSVRPIDGKCPEKWGVYPADGQCHRPCSVDTDCPRGIKCKAKFCTAN